MVKLIKNEIIKMLFKKKLILILAILILETSAFAYGQNVRYKRTIEGYTKNQSKNYNWKPLINQQIDDIKNKLSYKNVKKSDERIMKIQLEQYKYYLKKNISPAAISASKFTSELMEQSALMLLPLLIIILAGDIVSGEFSSKTIKVLLTRAVPRWKILLSKYTALILMSAFVVFLSAVVSLGISEFTFKDFGFMEPVISGYKVVNGVVNASSVVQIYQWQYLLLVCSLNFFEAAVIATIAFMVSILVRSTAASIGIMMAGLIGGSLLRVFLTDWPFAKYFFAVNLQTSQYLTGNFKGVPGMSLVSSMCVLIVWIVTSLIISFFAFTRRDVLV
ncbi:ABC transporter permease [Clostridium guangxiense]|uniref:ABC transporter permease n=1 Tax=Clostridium guangxiense TaxID=1662055 RepID=UPI001E31DD34|nr:ABC transporter permease [Clostridium guangxiense]MCD2345613.1 ABC transporter permease [Clostridium guangxiense]